MTLCSDSVADRRLGVPGPLRDRSRAETTHAQAFWAGLERGEAVPPDCATWVSLMETLGFRWQCEPDGHCQRASWPT